jgi:hypothetical protein
VTPRLAAGRTAGIEQFLFVPFDSLLYAIHIVGYSLMSVAKGVQKVARWFLISSGAIAAVHSAANVLALADLDRTQRVGVRGRNYSSLTA